MPRKPNSSTQTLDVLRVLVADHHAWHHGYGMIRRTGLRSGTLYPILARLERQGWLETAWQPSEDSGRPPRHTYRLTPMGEKEARRQLGEANKARGLPPARPPLDHGI